MADWVEIREATSGGMVSLRGDLADGALRAAVCGLTGTGFPEVGRAELAPGHGILWMAPDEVLILLPQGAASGAVATLEAALAGRHHLALDVSDMRAMVAIEGVGLREVLAKLVPVDMSPGVFVPGKVRRTRLGQVAAAFWLEAEDSARLVTFRSVGEYALALLRAAAAGGPVGHFAQNR